MLPTTTVTDLQKQQKLIFRRGDYNILNCGIRTGKTYWAINNLASFTRDGNLNRILFLTDTTALKGQLIQEYRDNCLKNITHEKINIEKCFETDFIKLEEEKYNLKLNHLLDINNILLEENQKALKHNKQMKNLYKIYTGKNWKNSE